MLSVSSNIHSHTVKRGYYQWPATFFFSFSMAVVHVFFQKQIVDKYFQLTFYLGSHISSSRGDSVRTVFSCAQILVLLPMLWIFNMHTDVNAFYCTRGCTVTVRISAVKADSGRKLPCLTKVSSPHQQHATRDAQPNELDPYPTPLQASDSFWWWHCRIRYSIYLS